MLRLKAWLRRTRPERGPAQDCRDAIDIILHHLDDHGRNLWGHTIQLPATADRPETSRIVDRTNNFEEGLFHAIKHDERRRSGRKTLTQDLDHLPASAALARNLRDADKVSLICGHLEKPACHFCGTRSPADEPLLTPLAARR